MCDRCENDKEYRKDRKVVTDLLGLTKAEFILNYNNNPEMLDDFMTRAFVSISDDISKWIMFTKLQPDGISDVKEIIDWDMSNESVTIKNRQALLKFVYNTYMKTVFEPLKVTYLSGLPTINELTTNGLKHSELNSLSKDAGDPILDKIANRQLTDDLNIKTLYDLDTKSTQVLINIKDKLSPPAVLTSAGDTLLKHVTAILAKRAELVNEVTPLPMGDNLDDRSKVSELFKNNAKFKELTDQIVSTKHIIKKLAKKANRIFDNIDIGVAGGHQENKTLYTLAKIYNKYTALNIPNSLTDYKTDTIHRINIILHNHGFVIGANDYYDLDDIIPSGSKEQIASLEFMDDLSLTVMRDKYLQALKASGHMSKNGYAFMHNVTEEMKKRNLKISNMEE